MTLSVDADRHADGYVLAEASWAMPGREEPFDPYLRDTALSIDTQAIKAAPVGERLAVSAAMFGKAGLDGTEPVAVYDRVGLFSAPWIWWLLRSHGCDAALVEGWGETRLDPPLAPPTQFLPTRDAGLMNANRDEVLAGIGTGVQIVDARPAGRFAGETPEPRPDCRAGHIPGSVNVPFGQLKSGRRFHAANDLRALFDDKTIDLSRPIITTCGSGVTASGLAFALTRCGAKNVKVYQGSWAEWGVDPDLPVETGS